MKFFKKLKDRKKPEDAIKEETPTTSDVDFQIRFLVERNILPSKINQEPIYIITSIIAEKGAFVNNYYRALYAQHNLPSPYTFEEFEVSVPLEFAGAKILRIKMPEKNLYEKLFSYVYIIYNESYTKHLYVCADSSKMYLLADEEYEEVGEIADNEIELLEQIIIDEEIREESYSDVLENLMKDAKPPEELLTKAEDIENHSKVFMAALLQVQKLKQENKREDALKLIKEVIKKETVKYEDTDLIEYRSFRNSFELLLYANLYHPYNPKKQQRKQIIGTQVDLASAYLVFGAMMLEQRQYDKAIDILKKGLKFNPVNIQLMFALADAYKGKKYMKSYLAVISMAHSCALRKTDIARIYRYYSKYYTEMKDYDTAFILLYSAKYFDAQGFTESLREVEQISGKSFTEPEISELKTKLGKIEISWGAKELVISVVNLLDKEYTQNKNQQGMRMCAELKKELSFEN